MEADLLDRLFAALNGGDPRSLDDVLAQEFAFEEVAGPGAASRDALKQEVAMLRAALPDLAFRPVRVSREGERLYAEFRAMGTHLRKFMNVPPTGAFVIVSGVFNLAVDDSAIRRLKLTVDFAGLRRQLLQAARRR